MIPETNTNLWLSMISLAGQDAPEADDIVDALRRDWPGLENVSVSESCGRLATITIDEAVAAVTHIPTPIPWSQLEGPCAVAWYWPQAEAALRSHDSHLLVTLVDECRSPLEKSIRLTQITAAIASVSAAPAGVFWGPGRLVHNPADFATSLAA